MSWQSAAFLFYQLEGGPEQRPSLTELPPSDGDIP